MVPSNKGKNYMYADSVLQCSHAGFVCHWQITFITDKGFVKYLMVYVLIRALPKRNMYAALECAHQTVHIFRG
jgi:hypothetical protein